MKRPVVIAFVAALSGCAVGPDFVAPTKPTVDRYVADGPQQLEAREIPADWWTLFRSPQLDALVAEALAHSPDIASAEAALRAANETALAQQGAFLPTVDAEYSPTRQSVSQVFSNPLNSSTYIYTLHTAQLSIGYVPDLFGGNRRQLESLVAQAAAQRYTLIAARLTLTTNVVVAAIQQASLRSQLRAAREVVATASRQLDLYRQSQSLGQSGSADVAAQETNVAQARAAVPPLEKQLAQQASLLAVLTGRLPADPSVAQSAFDIELDALPPPVDVPLTLPSTLVDQRPDVRIATEQLHAASALIGVAVANRLPNLSLTATGGSQALSLSRLFSAGTGFWSIGAGLTQPLFDGGTLLHRERAARANYDQAAAQYRKHGAGRVPERVGRADRDRSRSSSLRRGARRRRGRAPQSRDHHDAKGGRRRRGVAGAERRRGVSTGGDGTLAGRGRASGRHRRADAGARGRMVERRFG